MRIKLVEKVNPADRSKPAKWYAIPVNLGRKDIKSLSRHISGTLSLTRGETENVINAFLDELPVLLMDGFSVQLGDFGTMRLSLSSEGTEKPEDFSAAGIKPKVIFTPAVMLKKDLSNIKYFYQD